MMGLVITVHVIACIVLIAIVLIQRGKGGGLVENLSGIESMFGTKTSAFLTKATTVCSIIFFFTCLSLALLSKQRSTSLMRDVRVPEVAGSAASVKEPSVPNQPQDAKTNEQVNVAPAQDTKQQAPQPQ